MSPADRQSFEGCKAYLGQRAAPFDRTVAEARGLHKSGNPKEGCRLERKSLKMLDESIGSFESGKCDRIHDVAGWYKSGKIKGLEAKLIRGRLALQEKINRDCARY